MDYTCKVCGKRVRAIYIRTLAKFAKRQFSKADDGDWPGEITVDHYYNVRTTVNLYKLADHKQGLIFRKPCPGSGFTFKESFKSVGRPYIIHKAKRWKRQHRRR